MGSVTDHVLSATKLPMLVVHPAGQSKQVQVSDEQRMVCCGREESPAMPG